MIVTLPSHAQAIAPSPRPAASVASGATASTSPPGAKVSVNDRFFDDPKPRPIAMTSGTRGGK
jgi:hypothetical protein